jgi:hypothetical protein
VPWRTNKHAVDLALCVVPHRQEGQAPAYGLEGVAQGVFEAGEVGAFGEKESQTAF